jgi:hypothetical protein
MRISAWALHYARTWQPTPSRPPTTLPICRTRPRRAGSNEGELTALMENRHYLIETTASCAPTGLSRGNPEYRRSGREPS